MQKTGHSKVSISLRSGKRSVFLFVLFLFLLPVSVFAGITQGVSCPSVDYVDVVFSYRSVSNILIATNIDSRYFPGTPIGVSVYNQILRGRPVAGVVSLTSSDGNVVVTSCLESLPLPLQLVSENFLMGLAGSITAGLFVFALLKSAL